MAGGTTEPHYGTACGVIRSKEHFLTRNRKKYQKKFYFFLPEKYLLNRKKPRIVYIEQYKIVEAIIKSQAGM